MAQFQQKEAKILLIEEGPVSRRVISVIHSLRLLVIFCLNVWEVLFYWSDFLLKCRYVCSDRPSPRSSQCNLYMSCWAFGYACTNFPHDILVCSQNSIAFDIKDGSLCQQSSSGILAVGHFEEAPQCLASREPRNREEPQIKKLYDMTASDQVWHSPDVHNECLISN